MTEEEIKTLIRQELPKILREDPEVRDFVLRTVEDLYAGKQETESRFDRMLAELQRDREERSRQWEEYKVEQRRELDDYKAEQNRKWEEQQRLNWSLLEEIQALKTDVSELKTDVSELKTDVSELKTDVSELKTDVSELKTDVSQLKADVSQLKTDVSQLKTDVSQIKTDVSQLNRKHDSTIGALGARWGIYSESSFRGALQGILQESFGVQVMTITEYDEEGEVFGRPDQIELDLIIKNGLLIICEIKSSMSKPDIYTFEKKVNFYQKRHQRTATRKIVISPMVNPRAKEIGEQLGMEVYSYAEEVETN